MSISDERATIVLGGVEYPVKAFTLDQLQEAMTHFTALDKISAECDAEKKVGILEPSAYHHAAKIVEMAVGENVDAGFDEVWPALEVIRGVSGLVPLMARLTAMIEAASRESTGTNSTPTS